MDPPSIAYAEFVTVQLSGMSATLGPLTLRLPNVKECIRSLP